MAPFMSAKIDIGQVGWQSTCPAARMTCLLRTQFVTGARCSVRPPSRGRLPASRGSVPSSTALGRDVLEHDTQRSGPRAGVIRLTVLHPCSGTSTVLRLAPLHRDFLRNRHAVIPRSSRTRASCPGCRRAPCSGERPSDRIRAVVCETSTAERGGGFVAGG